MLEIIVFIMCVAVGLVCMQLLDSYYVTGKFKLKPYIHRRDTMKTTRDAIYHIRKDGWGNPVSKEIFRRFLVIILLCVGVPFFATLIVSIIIYIFNIR